MRMRVFKTASDGYSRRGLVPLVVLACVLWGPPLAQATTARVTVSGDVVGLSVSKTVRQSSRLARPATVVVAAKGGRLPANGVGAVLISIDARGASRPGRVLVGPAGGAGTSVAVSYRRLGKASGTALVKVGRRAAITVRATAGAPKVKVAVRGWVPRTSSTTVPASPLNARAAGAGRNRTRFKVAGGAGAPAGSEAVLVAVQTAGARVRGKLSVVSTGATTKVTVAGFGPGDGTALVLARPGISGAIDVTASTKVKLRARVVGWAGTGELSVAPQPAAAGTVVGSKKLSLKGRYGVPAAAIRSVVVSVAGTTGNALQVVTLDGAGAGRVTSPGGKASVTVVGWIANPGGASTSYVPKPGTVVLGAGDVVSIAAGKLTLDRSVDPPKVGNYVFTRVPGRVANVLVRVTGVATSARRTVLTVTDGGALSAAFSDFDSHYAGPLTLASGQGRSGRASLRALKLSVPLGDVGFFTCAAGVDIPGIQSWSLDLVDANTNFDLNLGDRLLDFSTKGRLILKLNLGAGRGSVTCSLNSTIIKPFVEVQLGATPFSVKFGPALSLSAIGKATPSELTGTARFAAGFSYIDGRTSDLHAGSVDANSETPPPSLKLKAGVSVSIGFSSLVEFATPVDPSASVTASAQLALASPERNSDGELRGPRCVDLTANFVVDIGAKVALNFFPDISLPIASFETPKLVLFKGPCYGYIGTVTYTATGTYDDGTRGTVYDEGVTLTLKPGEPARYEAIDFDIRQPHSWSAYNRNRSYIYRDNGASVCTTRQENGAGTGARPSGVGGNAIPATVLARGLETYDLVNGGNRGYTGSWPAILGENAGEGGTSRLPGASWTSDCASRRDLPDSTGVTYVGSYGRVTVPQPGEGLPAYKTEAEGGSSVGAPRQRVVYDLTRVEVAR